MKNYTTQTAALKATTIDTRFLDVSRVDVKKLFVNGESLEDVILQTSPKGINNAVRISTTIGSINGTSLIVGDYEIGLSSGMLYIMRTDNLSGLYWKPVHISLNREMICPEMNIHSNGMHWEIQLWNGFDDWKQIYGGINDNTSIEVLIVIPEVQDGDEPVQTTLTGNVQHNVVYHLGEESTLKLTLPTNLVDNYSAEVVFTSGAIPTTLMSDSRIKWVGDDVSGGVFTPVDNVRYSCSLQYDGVFVRGMTFGIPTV